MSVAELRQHYDAERRDFETCAEALSPHELASPSLCAGWSVEDVIAHVRAWERLLRLPSVAAYPAQLTRLGWRMLRARGDTNRLNEQLRRSARRERAAPPAERHLFDRLAPGSQLAELVIHHQDIRRPLGQPRDIPAGRLRAALDGLARVPGIDIQRHTTGTRWIATDLDWSVGQGDEIRRPAEVILMTLAGRLPVDQS